uniref:Uncharacterized protein n=1 Tax=Leishmania guyanensis TaxID=5670 RepID=A0A1E1IXI1_LEIGU|nr:Hypothetical protein BN36_2435200 [Leishmania guyanensis]
MQDYNTTFLPSLLSPVSSRMMPPRAARSRKNDSVGVAIKRHLRISAAATVTARANGKCMEAVITAAPALEADVAASNPSSSRVSRRRRDVVPQEAPAWQRMALKTAAAASRLGKRGSSAEAKYGGCSSTTTAKKTKSNGRRKGVAAEKAEDEAPATAESSSQKGEDADHSASHAESDAISSSSSKRAKPRRGKVGKAGTTPATRRGQRVPVTELVCPRCKLRMDQWPFCGLSGEAHVLRAPWSAAKEDEEEQPNEVVAAAAAAAR